MTAKVVRFVLIAALLLLIAVPAVGAAVRASRGPPTSPAKRKSDNRMTAADVKRPSCCRKASRPS